MCQGKQRFLQPIAVGSPLEPTTPVEHTFGEQLELSIRCLVGSAPEDIDAA